jgi:hypothetical protein
MVNWITKLNTLFVPRELSQARMVTAVAVAAVADLLQIVLLPVAWTFAQEAIDVVAMGLTMALLGFHLLLLPTFAVEFIPVVDMLPTWTGCVVAVIALRKRAGRDNSSNAVTIVQASPPEQPPRQLDMEVPTKGLNRAGNDPGNPVNP